MFYFQLVLLVVLFLPAPYENLVLPNRADSKLNKRKNHNGPRRCVLGEEQLRERAEECNRNFTFSKFDRNNGEERGRAIAWIKNCIVDYYCFKKHETFDEWIEQPSFNGSLDQQYFEVAATFSQEFFKIYANWQDTKKQFNEDRTSLLYITAARYVYTTFVLYQESRPQHENGSYIEGQKGRLVPCEVIMTTDNTLVDQYILPAYSCYPSPIGSATATSDYDVSLIGPKSGDLVANFNDKFKEIFDKDSETLFDTNIYAYALEYAMPSKIHGKLLSIFTQNQIFRQ